MYLDLLNPLRKMIQCKSLLSGTLTQVIKWVLISIIQLEKGHLLMGTKNTPWEEPCTHKINCRLFNSFRSWYIYALEYRLFTPSLESGLIPKSWTKGTITVIPKDGDLTDREIGGTSHRLLFLQNY